MSCRADDGVDPPWPWSWGVHKPLSPLALDREGLPSVFLSIPYHLQLAIKTAFLGFCASGLLVDICGIGRAAFLNAQGAEDVLSCSLASPPLLKG